MRLIKQKGRDYGNREYFKFLVVVPNKLIKLLRWKGGEDLEAAVKSGKLIIKKD